MTDTSPYTIEERLIAAVWVHDRVLEKRTMIDVSAKFQERFKKSALKKNILLAWEKKTFASGSVLYAPRSGRPASRMEHVEIIQQFPILQRNRLVRGPLNCKFPAPHSKRYSQVT
ncbi:hypothetical protein BsWGS_23287 [Bradybaena similaris]